MANINWFNKTAAATVEWLLSIEERAPVTGSLPPGSQHSEPRVDRCQLGIRCLGFSGAVAFSELNNRDIDVFIS